MVCPRPSRDRNLTRAWPSTYHAAPSPTGVPMSVSAYILIQTEVGKASAVVEACRKLPGVVQADDVTGPYDVILRTEAGSIDELGRMVVSQVQLVDGITRTLTCPVVHL